MKKYNGWTEKELIENLEKDQYLLTFDRALSPTLKSAIPLQVNEWVSDRRAIVTDLYTDCYEGNTFCVSGYKTVEITRCL